MRQCHHHGGMSSVRRLLAWPHWLEIGPRRPGWSQRRSHLLWVFTYRTEMENSFIYTDSWKPGRLRDIYVYMYRKNTYMYIYVYVYMCMVSSSGAGRVNPPRLESHPPTHGLSFRGRSSPGGLRTVELGEYLPAAPFPERKKHCGKQTTRTKAKSGHPEFSTPSGAP